MAVQIGPAPPHNPAFPHTNLPSDEVLLEETIRNAIRDIFLSIPGLDTYVKIQSRDRFPQSGEEDITIATVSDQIVSGLRRTSLIQIGVPTVEEFERTSDLHTQLNFTYPITFDLEVVDEWREPLVPVSPLIYKNSRALYMAVYMVSRRAFKNNRTFGFNNVQHTYLQQVNVGTLDEEESGRIHAGDWSLTVQCTGILV